MDVRHGIYHTDLLWPARGSRAAKAELHRSTEDERVPLESREITFDTTSAYEMLRASASVTVPLLCLAAKD